MLKSLLNYLTIECALNMLFDKIMINFPIFGNTIKCGDVIKYIRYEDVVLQYEIEYYESKVISITCNSIEIKPTITIRTTNYDIENLTFAVWTIDFKYIKEILH